MPKQTLKKQPVEIVENDEETEIIDEELEKEFKFSKMLSSYKDLSGDYFADLYKFVRNKREFVETYQSELPSLKEIKTGYGGGKYRIYIKSMDGELMDSADVNIISPEDLPANSSVNAPVNTRKDILSEIQVMAEIIKPGGNGGSGGDAVLLKIMETVSSQSKELMRMQMDSEKRMMDLILQIQNKKTDVGEFIDIYKTLSDLRENEQPSSPIEKLITSPAVLALLQNLPGVKEPPAAMPMSEAKALPAPPPPVKQTAQDLINILMQTPDNARWIESITPENAEAKIKHLYEKNKNQLDMETATGIVLTILKNKELKNE